MGEDGYSYKPRILNKDLFQSKISKKVEKEEKEEKIPIEKANGKDCVIEVEEIPKEEKNEQSEKDVKEKPQNNFLKVEKHKHKQDNPKYTSRRSSGGSVKSVFDEDTHEETPKTSFTFPERTKDRNFQIALAVTIIVSVVIGLLSSFTIVGILILIILGIILYLLAKQNPIKRDRFFDFWLYRRNSNYYRTTKYRVYNFFILSILTQLRRISNVYFILVMVVNMIVASIPPVTSIFPVCFIFGVTMIKDLIEDIGRFISDIGENYKKVSRYNKFTKKFNNSCPSCHITRGDIIKVHENETIPADIIILKSSKEDGLGYLETANLDGETNLKRKEAIFVSSLSEKEVFQAKYHFEIPEENSTSLEVFDGVLRYSKNTEAEQDENREEKEKPEKTEEEVRKDKDNKKEIQKTLKEHKNLGIDNLMLRGCVLKNTKYIIGMVAYAGKETKMFRNAKKKKTKWGKLDIGLNYFVFSLLFFQQLMIVMLVVGEYLLDSRIAKNTWYLSNLGLVEYSVWGYIKYFVEEYMNFLVLFDILVPMSLFVTLEIVKAFQAYSMQLRVKDEETGQQMTAKTSNLNWDLAFIDIIFSDKTGTLTQNKMEYQKCYVGNQFFNKDEEIDVSRSNKNAKINDLFLSAVVINNSVTPSIENIAKNGDNQSKTAITYGGTSTDEITLVEKLAYANNYVLLTRNSERIEFSVGKNNEKGILRYKILRTVQFNSTRKRMSLFVEQIKEDTKENGQLQPEEEGETVICFSKGADSEIFSRVKDGENIENHEAAADKFSKKGLRTLVYAYKEIKRSEFNEWNTKMEIAEENKTFAGKEEVAILEDEMENNFNILGVTAIEDKLQDQVPETIKCLLDGDIKIWVLTGDKTETAISICYTANVIDKGKDWEIRMTHRDYTGVLDLKEKLQKICDHISKKKIEIEKKEEKFVMVVDSISLEEIINNYERMFIKIIENCASVICCRVTPLQKAIVTGLVQKKLHLRGLAIGDGANDVSMIQKAYVGVGIMGQEGTQAARSSDYALPKFKYLQQLLFVEGRYAYLRSADCIFVSFYKNCILATINVIYSFFNLVTGQWMIDAWLYQLYNTIFHALVPVHFGFFEKDIDEDVLMANPQYYANLKKQKPYFNIWKAVFWIIKGMAHAIFSFFIAFFVCHEGNLYGSVVDSDEIFTFGNIVVTGFMLSIFINQFLNSRKPTIYLIASIVVSLCSYFAFILFDSLFTDFLTVTTFYYISIFSLDKLKFYIVVLFIVACNTFTSFCIKYIGLQLRIQDWQKALFDTKPIKIVKEQEEMKQMTKD